MAEQLWLARLLLTPSRRPAHSAGENPGSTPEWLICALPAIPGIQ